MDLRLVKKVYCIGIKGAGMAAIAEIFKGHKKSVSGSDTDEIFFTDEALKRSGIKYKEGFSADNIPSGTDLIIYSTAYNEKNNPEVVEAKKRNIPMMSYSEALGELFKEKFGIAVCGTHGKTTTTAMLAECMNGAGVNPEAIVGSRVIQWQGSALHGEGKYFVAEADEYQNKLQHYNPLAVVLTSVDWDHPDYFPTFDDYKKVFEEFVARIPRHGFLICCGDDADAIKVSKSAKCEVLKYGFGKENDYMVNKHRTKNGNQSFTVFYNDKKLGDFSIGLPGKHNILNAIAAIAVCYKLGLNLDKVGEALKNFQGTARRFEYIGERNNAILIDDYAHHPEEVKATLKAAREIYPRKNIQVVFHPHTFTRTKALLQEFSQSFNNADRVIVMDIYGSAREEQGGVSSKDLVDLINKYNPDRAEYVATIDEVVELLRDKIGKNDVVFSMGAGDVWRVVDKLKEKLT